MKKQVMKETCIIRNKNINITIVRHTKVFAQEMTHPWNRMKTLEKRHLHTLTV